jgi:MFS family permease
MAAFTIAYGAFEIPWGFLADRLGVRNILAAIILGGVVACFVGGLFSDAVIRRWGKRVGRRLVGARWFARDVVLNRWFLHSDEPVLSY